MPLYRPANCTVLVYWIENGVIMCGSDITDPMQSAHDMETFKWAIERGMMIPIEPNPFTLWNKLKTEGLK